MTASVKLQWDYCGFLPLALFFLIILDRRPEAHSRGHGVCTWMGHKPPPRTTQGARRLSFAGDVRMTLSRVRSMAGSSSRVGHRRQPCGWCAPSNEMPTRDLVATLPHPRKQPLHCTTPIRNQLISCRVWQPEDDELEWVPARRRMLLCYGEMRVTA